MAFVMLRYYILQNEALMVIVVLLTIIKFKNCNKRRQMIKGFSEYALLIVRSVVEC